MKKTYFIGLWVIALLMILLIHLFKSLIIMIVVLSVMSAIAWTFNYVNKSE
jgi:hypothetical protein